MKFSLGAFATLASIFFATSWRSIRISARSKIPNEDKRIVCSRHDGGDFKDLLQVCMSDHEFGVSVAVSLSYFSTTTMDPFVHFSGVVSLNGLSDAVRCKDWPRKPVLRVTRSISLLPRPDISPVIPLWLDLLAEAISTYHDPRSANKVSPSRGSKTR